MTDSGNTTPLAPEPDEHDAPVRSEHGLIGKIVFVLGVGISLLHLYFNILTVLPSLWQNALHFAGFGLMCALLFPSLRQTGGRRDRVVLAVDAIFGVVVAGAAIFLISHEDAIYARGVHLVTSEWIAGGLLILGAIEFTRRTTGWIIPVLIVLALTYVGWWGEHISGVFRFAGLSPETILFRSIFGDDGLFGNIALISSTFVFMFILFGAFLLRSGAGDFVIDLARAVAGRTVGGPGLVAVFASALTGTISGSAVANTASTGVITIPLMKKAGFPPRFAAAVEAAASTGGQLMPPIMGAGAFVMASYTQIPYTTIIAVSVIPAILYFASVAFFVRLEAKRSNVQQMDAGTLRPMEVIRRGGLPFLLPVTVLIVLLVLGFTPTYAAGISIVAVIVSSWLTPKRMGPRAIVEALALGARNMVMTGVLLCAIGLVVNVIATAGVGNTFSLMITQWAGSSLIVAIVLIGLASLVLGMGLPVTASYIVLGTLSAPALYNLIADAQVIDAIARGVLSDEAKAVLMLVAPDQIAALGHAMSVDAATAIFNLVPVDLADALRTSVLDAHATTFALLSAHMIIFWLSQDSNVTPPVCLTAFTAAAIARTPPMATGLEAWKVAKGLYVVPLLFAYTPLLGGSWGEIAEFGVFALIGLYAFSAGLQGYLEHRLGWALRAVLIGVAILLLWPLPIWVHGVGVAAFAALFVFSRRQGAGPSTVAPA
ncbi:TRAP transporter fused permease subunit [Nitrogeniibacter mangrovi]|uniref:TRAP transporter fused permease subunit n=1 Tax=Nitrogeniibacter mangrovi TaxID=2016596 RepID=A0A6C1B5B3_9RHOO|nr:TRAP transporter fused permease subunit [Nitrogeniibacter mangrovi]QID17968.1 TRAP transporter fused permease subunit [Nitrogeniibacter mangrovi]